ncbi:TonB-dependent siderophore receptor [Granulosicoccaceae sp. 1_MG-2023]|nr:TonB-dependent siderophore receptor [Granulosicoccaceae sp. 1_MG-2023]
MNNPEAARSSAWKGLAHFKFAKLVLAMGLSVSLCHIAAADDAAQTGPLRLETLSVEGNKLYGMEASEVTEGYAVEAATVGTKTPAALRDIPQSITVLTRDYLDDRQFVNLDDMAKYTPGLRTLTNDSGRSSVYARGYEYDQSNIDGLPAPMSSIYGTLPSLAAIDRVEIMRGPSGLFSSTSELGGIINLVRKRPTEAFQGHLTGRYGSWNSSVLEADVSGGLSQSGSVRGRLLANDTRTDGEVDYNDSAHQTLYGALDVDLSEDTMLALGVLHTDRDITPSNGLPANADGSLLDIDRSRFFGADWNSFDGSMTDVFAQLSHDFANGGYGQIGLRTSNRDADLFYAYTSAGVDSDGETSMSGLDRTFDQDTYALDVSYSQPFAALGQVSEFVVGADHKHYKTAYKNGSFSLGTINIYDYSADQFDKPDVDYTTGVDSEESETGLYAKLTFRPVQNLALIGGARVSWYDSESTSENYSSGVAVDDEQNHDGELTPYAGLVYDLNHAHSLYASYSEVFKPQDETGADGEMLDPREGQQFELGVKGSYYNGLLNSRFTVFRLDDKNRAATAYDSSGNTLSYSEASGETRITGGEVELSGSPTDGLDLIAGYTYMDTENREGDVNTLFMLMPRHQVSLWGKYSFNEGPVDGLSVGVGVTGMSDFYLERSGTRLEAPGYAVVDAKLAYQITPRLKATLDVNNLFDREYYSRVGSVATFNFYGPSRNVMAGLRYDL